MFENTIAYRRSLKKEKLISALEEAKTNGNEWKIKQLEAKLADFNRKNYPKTFWDSSKGTYTKPKEVQNEFDTKR